MTVSTQVSRNEYTGNGATTQYDFTFRIFDKSHLLVQTMDTSENIVTLTLGTDYTVTGVNRYNGGKVVLTSALQTGYKISIERSTPVTQEASIRNQGGFFPEIHEDALDKLTMLVQQAYGWWSGLSLRKPSWLANYYDALNNRIRNLRDPSQAQDAATKSYVDSGDNDSTHHADSLFQRTLRVPESQVGIMASVRARANMLVGCNDQGDPVPIAGQTQTADLAIKLASKDGAGLVATETGRTVEASIRAASGSSQALFPKFINKITAYRHGVSGYQNLYRAYGFGSSVGNGEQLPDPSTQAPIAKFFEYMNDALNKQRIYPLSFVNKSVNGSTINNFLANQWPAVVTEGIYPDIALFIYGMNDFPTAQYNAGQTFNENGFKQRLRTAINLVREAGGDVVLTTTPHPYIANYSWSMPPGVSQVWPKTSPAPVSDADIIPPASESVVEFVWNGVKIKAGVRFLRGNDAIRQIAVEMSCVLIDVEKYWFDAVAKYGESALYNNDQLVHPNLFGHQQSYWLAFEDFFRNLDRNGWIPAVANHYDVFDVGGKATFPNPRTADIDLQSNGIRANAYIHRDQFARPLLTISHDGIRTYTSYTSQDPASNAGYNISYIEYDTRFKGLFSTGEVQPIAIPNRTTQRIFIDAWSSSQNTWTECLELFVSNREGTISFAIVSELDTTPPSGGGGTSGGRRLFSVSSGSGVLNITANVNLTTLKVRVGGYNG
ncbi:TPA: phage tail fiber protein [Klebsiella pneumoniae]